MGTPQRNGIHTFWQNGRIALVNYGPDAGKLVMIVDVIDDKSASATALLLGSHAGSSPTSASPSPTLSFQTLAAVPARRAPMPPTKPLMLRANGLPPHGARSSQHARLRPVPTTTS